MKHKVYRAIINYRKEEAWLNRMAQKGLHLVDYTFCRYLFEEGKPGEYIYRMELLKNMPGDPETDAYLRFMEENGVECVSTFWRWAYFRKNAGEGNFEIYSDRKDKIKHARRVIGLMLTLFFLNLGCALSNLGLGLDHLREGFLGFNAYFSALNFTVAVVLLIITVSQVRIIRDLKKDKGIME
jgi:hypothetical protein